MIEKRETTAERTKVKGDGIRLRVLWNCHVIEILSMRIRDGIL